MASWVQLQNDKNNAIRRFQTKPYLENIFHFFNICGAIFLLSHSCFFPFTLQTFSHFYHLFLPLFHNSFYAFLLLNAIILFLFLFALSNNNHTHSCLVVTVPQEQYGTLDSSYKKVTTTYYDSPTKSSSPAFEETVRAVTETTACCTTVTRTEGETVSVSEKKCYRRVRRGELKRRLCRVEQLSEEEFNRAVEEFIAMHKKMQLEEQIGSYTQPN
ncbi:hypothetical protein VNO78_00390 [Psophocarpus tetragonolobus]|uniref:DUF4408 domain-containing protein n=1 Tax=Psophocarpus tetragonolobus TaxID=3891 RepID=A0AAN9SYE4_PSOTE